MGRVAAPACPGDDIETIRQFSSVELSNAILIMSNMFVEEEGGLRQEQAYARLGFNHRLALSQSARLFDVPGEVPVRPETIFKGGKKPWRGSIIS